MRRGYGYEPGRLPPPEAAPSGRAMVEGYRKEIVGGFDRDKPRYNPVGLRTRVAARANGAC